jgi:hypothetical protein
VVTDAVGRVPLDLVTPGVAERGPTLEESREPGDDPGDGVTPAGVVGAERLRQRGAGGRVRFGEDRRRQAGRHLDRPLIGHVGRVRHSARPVVYVRPVLGLGPATVYNAAVIAVVGAIVVALVALWLIRAVVGKLVAVVLLAGLAAVVWSQRESVHDWFLHLNRLL